MPKIKIMKTVNYSIAQLEAMSSDQLRKAATELGIKNSSKFKKAELLSIATGLVLDMKIMTPTSMFEEQQEKVIDQVEGDENETDPILFPLPEKAEVAVENETASVELPEAIEPAVNIDYTNIRVSLINPQIRQPKAGTKAAQIFEMLKLKNKTGYAIARELGILPQMVANVKKHYKAELQ